jgi:hypothetical protein
MSLLRFSFLLLSTATAICALTALRYWYLSSRPTPEMAEPPVASISDDPAQHIMEAQVNAYSIQASLIETSRLNKKRRCGVRRPLPSVESPRS